MRGRTAALVATVLLSTAALGAQVFRAGVETVLLAVTVSDAKGQSVRLLAQEDFRVIEDGIPQEISVFARDQQPISLSLLIDSSTSMEPKMAVAQEAAIGFARRLGPSDVAQIIDFNSDTRIRQTFTSDHTALETAIRQVRPSGSTSLYTAIYIALSELGRMRVRTRSEIRRQAIVLLSDGEDTTSLKTYDDVAELAKKQNVTIFAIGLRVRDMLPNRRFNEGDFALRTLSQITGGRSFFVDDIQQLSGIYGQIADELANQYIIGYVPKNTTRDGAWRQVSVRVARSETVARTRTGYFAPTGTR